MTARRGRTPMNRRPRGFVADWRPRPETAALVDRVSEIINAYVAQLLLIQRQIFYILVDRHAYEKIELGLRQL
jgi:hypothetical protein